MAKGDIYPGENYTEIEFVLIETGKEIVSKKHEGNLKVFSVLDGGGIY